MDLRDQYMCYLEEVRKRSALTLEAYRKDLGQFFDYVNTSKPYARSGGERPLFLLVGPDIAATYGRILARRGLCPSSVNRKLTMLHGFYVWLVKTGHLKTNPFVPPSSRQCRASSFSYVDTASVQRLFSVISTRSWLGVRDRAILGLLFNTGMRISELLGIQTGDIQWPEKILTIRAAGKPSRRCILWNWVMEELHHYNRLRQEAASKPIPHFFVNRDGGPLSGRSVRRKLSAYGRQAELSVPITPATLRHSYAMLMLQNGVRPLLVKRQMGHLSDSSLRPYLECLKQEVVSGPVGVCR